MTTNDLIANLEQEYWSIQEANPNWDKTLWNFLTGRGIASEDIWEYSPSIGRTDHQPEPEQL